MTAWIAINSVLIVALMLVQFLTMRQVGVLLNRLSPGGAKDLGVGPRIGENVTWLKKELGLNGHGMALLLVFGSTSCPICKQVMKAAEKLSNMWKESAQIAVLIEGGDAKESKPVGADSSFIRIHTSNIYRQQLNIPMVPFAFVVDDKQLVLGKGVVNEVSHMEGLLSLISEKDSRA